MVNLFLFVYIFYYFFFFFNDTATTEIYTLSLHDALPLCHPLPLSSVQVDLTPTARGYDIEARARTTAQTGVEMEALTAVAVAALTIYDMVKAIDKSMVIGDIRLEFKSGGRSGTYRRS